MKISIVIPSYNQASFIARTLDSVFSQDYRPLEVIVVDGASTDETLDLLKAYSTRHCELKWYSEPDNGPADAVNKGLSQVTGDLVGIQSSDDIYSPTAFQVVAAEFRAHPDCGLVYGDVAGINECDDVLYINKYPDFSWEAYFARSMTLQQGSIFFRRSLAEKVGGWNCRYHSCDVEYWMRLIFRTQPRHIPKVLSGWRQHSAMRTRPENSLKIWRDYWLIVDESIDIANAPRKVRRLAVASKHLLVLRFPPKSSQLVLWKHLLRGIILHPSYWRYNPRPMMLKWMPGHRYILRSYRYFKHIFKGGRNADNIKLRDIMAREL